MTTGEFNPLANDDDSGYVEVGTKTTVYAIASAWDERAGEASGSSGCGEEGQGGCMPALTRDGDTIDVESRWSCSEEIANGQCWITFAFEKAQYIMDMEVDLWKGDERKRTLKVRHWVYHGTVPYKSEDKVYQDMISARLA